MRTFFGVLLILLVSGCRHPTGYAVGPENPPLEFEAAVADWQSRRPVTAAGDPGEIAVAGSLSVPNGGYELSAAVHREGESEYVVEVTARMASGGITIAVNHVYAARLQELPPGRYRVRVVHTEVAPDGSEDRRTVLRQTVTVR